MQSVTLTDYVKEIDTHRVTFKKKTILIKNGLVHCPVMMCSTSVFENSQMALRDDKEIEVECVYEEFL